MSDENIEINLASNKKNIEDIKNEKQEIMILAIELGDNEKKFLKIYSDSKPEQLAYDFCLQNHLDFDSLQELTEQIKNALRQKGIIIQSNTNVIELNNNVNTNQNILPESNNNNNNKDNTIENLSQLLDNNNNILQKSQNINNSNDLRVKNKNVNNPIKNKKNHNYLSQTVSSKTKNRNSNVSMGENNNINNNNINNIIQSVNNNIENEYEINISQSNYNPSNTTGNDFRKNRPLTTTNKENYMLNYGERLYHKGLKLKEKTNEKIQKIKNDRDKNLKKNCTFKPKVNNISYAALTNRYNNKLSYNDEDNIINYKDYRNNKLEYLKEKYEKTQDFYSFAPKINKRSVTIDKNNIGQLNKFQPRYEQLYKNYKKKELDIHNLSNKIYDKNILFKPKVNEYNSELLNLPFNERQNAYQSKTNERKKKMKELIENPIDNHTGQKFFSPLINTNYERKFGINNKLDTFENLYYDYQKKEAKINKLTNQISNEENPNLIYVNDTSNNIYNEQKINSFKKIFKLLDKDQDGIISKFHVENDNLPNNINKIFNPIIEELKVDNQTLSEEEFVAASFRLFDTLNILQKRDVINFGLNKKKKKISDYEFTFAPKINKNYNSNILRREIDDKDRNLVESKESKFDSNNNKDDEEEKNSNFDVIDNNNNNNDNDNDNENNDNDNDNDNNDNDNNDNDNDNNDNDNNDNEEEENN